MIAMSKFEMVQYLKDYSNLQVLMLQCPDKTIEELFDNYMLSNNRSDCDTLEYYDRMCRVYRIYMMMKMFSFLEDFLLNRDNYINNNEIKNIEPENLYSTNLKGVINKKILQLIRDGFNHNNEKDEIDRFKISPNGKNIEIEFLKVKHEKGIIEPVKMKFSFVQICDIYEDMLKKRQNGLTVGFDIPNDFNINSKNLYEELGKIKFVHYYFNQKLSRGVVEKFNELCENDGLSLEQLNRKRIEFEQLASSISLPVKYELSNDQKIKLQCYIKKCKKYNPDLLNDGGISIMHYFLDKVIPVPGLKIGCIENQILYCGWFMFDPRKSSKKIVDSVYQIALNGENPFNESDDWGQKIFETFNKKTSWSNFEFFTDLLDGDFFVTISKITYIDCVVTHCCKADEIITIGGKDYKADKIRNSFAHGRWYIASNNCIILFDADPRNINDYKLEEVGKIDINLFEKWADSYFEQNKKKISIRKY